MKARLVYMDWKKAISKSTTFFNVLTHGEFLHDKPELYEVRAEVEVEFDDHVACEDLFREFNIGETRRKFRSLSVGDCIFFESGKFFVCKTIGWEPDRRMESLLRNPDRLLADKWRALLSGPVKGLDEATDSV